MAGKKKAIRVPRRRARRAPARIRYLAALVRLEADRAAIQAWTPASRPPRPGTMHPAAITGLSWESFPPGAGEIVVSFHDRNGDFLDGMAWWARADYFGDRRGGKSGRLAGGCVPPRVDVRMLHTEVPAGATFLVIHRVEVQPGRRNPTRRRARRTVEGTGKWGPVRLVTKRLACYLIPGGPEIPEDECPNVFPIPTFSPGVLEYIRTHLMEHFPAAGWLSSRLSRKGWVDSQETIFDGSSDEGKFNIIILGDGFKEGELTAFSEKANKLAEAILDTEPFQSLSEYLRIHVVRCVSYDSGITRCSPDPSFDCTKPYKELDTYLEVEGCWINELDPACLASSPTYLGVENPEYVYEAAADIAPYEDVGLYIVLANVDVYGGSAFRSQKLAFVPVNSEESTFFGLGLHESAHVLGDLYEEYTSPLPWDGSTHRNEVYEDVMDAAWWSALASPNELHGGKFKYVYRCPDDIEDGECVSTYNDPSLSDAADPDVIGLFWGAQFIDPEDDPCTMDVGHWDCWTNKLGNHFYRPMARCRMRVLGWEYCRVCSHEIEDAIRGGLV